MTRAVHESTMPREVGWMLVASPRPCKCGLARPGEPGMRARRWLQRRGCGRGKSARA